MKSLSDEEWNAPSACAGWTVRDVVSHVIGAEAILLGAPAPEVALSHLTHMRNPIAAANEVWVEAGPRLAGAFVRAGLFDELIVYVAPALLGGDALTLLQLPAIANLADKVQLRFTDFRAVGDDLRLTLRPA